MMALVSSKLSARSVNNHAVVKTIAEIEVRVAVVVDVAVVAEAVVVKTAHKLLSHVITNHLMKRLKVKEMLTKSQEVRGALISVVKVTKAKDARKIIHTTVRMAPVKPIEATRKVATERATGERKNQSLMLLNWRSKRPSVRRDNNSKKNAVNAAKERRKKLRRPRLRSQLLKRKKLVSPLMITWLRRRLLKLLKYVNVRLLTPRTSSLTTMTTTSVSNQSSTSQLRLIANLTLTINCWVSQARMSSLDKAEACAVVVVAKVPHVPTRVAEAKKLWLTTMNSQRFEQLWALFEEGPVKCLRHCMSVLM